MTQEKYTKKVTAYIYKELVKVNPKISKLTSLDQAYVILMDKWDMQLSVNMIDYKTKCVLYNKDDEALFEWDFKEDIWDKKQCDWNWSVIYKDVLEDIIKQKLYKPKKKSKRSSNKLNKISK